MYAGLSGSASVNACSAVIAYFFVVASYVTYPDAAFAASHSAT